MRFQRVRIAAVVGELPPQRVSSAQLERRLAPLYDRLRLREGRLELMSGIAERRFWTPGTRPSEVATRAGARALEASGVPRDRIGCLIHASVCRDFLEPATASVVHDALGLSPSCAIFDLSNACLGVLNAMVLIAGMIERGDIEAGLVVAGEDARGLVEGTLRDLLQRAASIDRDAFKQAFASLTIGSGAAAVVLAKTAERTDRRLVGGCVRTASEHNALCRGATTDHPGDPSPRMTTHSEQLLGAGNLLAKQTFEDLLDELAWDRDRIDRVVTHQVGAAHRRTLFETLDLDPDRDRPTFRELGNTGSAALPTALAIAVDEGFVRSGHRVALLGIGSGLSCLMLGLEW